MAFTRHLVAMAHQHMILFVWPRFAGRQATFVYLVYGATKVRYPVGFFVSRSLPRIQRALNTKYLTLAHDQAVKGASSVDTWSSTMTRWQPVTRLIRLNVWVIYGWTSPSLFPNLSLQHRIHPKTLPLVTSFILHIFPSLISVGTYPRVASHYASTILYLWLA